MKFISIRPHNSNMYRWNAICILRNLLLVNILLICKQKALGYFYALLCDMHESFRAGVCCSGEDIFFDISAGHSNLTSA